MSRAAMAYADHLSGHLGGWATPRSAEETAGRAKPESERPA